MFGIAYGLASPVLAATPPPPGKAQIANQTGADIWVGFWSPGFDDHLGFGLPTIGCLQDDGKSLERGNLRRDGHQHERPVTLLRLEDGGGRQLLGCATASSDRDRNEFSAELFRHQEQLHLV